MSSPIDPRRHRAPRCYLAIACLAAVTLPFAALAHGSEATDDAASLAVVAAAKGRAGEFAACAELYGQAYRLRPSSVGYLYSAARCAQRGGARAAAERDYRAFLARAPTADALRPHAIDHLRELTGPAAQAVDSGVSRPAPRSSAATTLAARADPRPVVRNNTAGWTAVGLSAALMVVGGWFAWDAQDRASELEARFVPPPGRQRITGIDYATAVAEADIIDRTGAVGFALIGLGAVTGAAAGWLFASAESPPVLAGWSIQPLPTGIKAAWRW